MAGGNCQYGSQIRSHGDRSGAGQGDRKEDDIHSSRENEQNLQPKAVDLDGGPRGETTRGGHLPNSQYHTNPKGKRDDPLSQNTVSHSKVQEQALYTETQQTNEPKNTIKDQTSDNVRKSADAHIQRLNDKDGQHDDNRPTGHTGSQENPKGCDKEALRKTYFKESMDTDYSPEEEQKSDKGNADLVNQDGNQRNRKARQQPQSVDEHQLGGVNEVAADVYYNDMSMSNTPYDGRKGRGIDQQVKHGKRSDEDDRTETFTCSNEQFMEVCFFNQGIDNKIEIKFNHNNTECYITERFGNFRNAKDQLSSYARKEIGNLTSTEEGKFTSYYEKEKENMASMNILCEYNPSLKRIRLVGKNYDNVERAECMILKYIGRSCHQSDQQSKPRRRKGKLPPSGSEVLKIKDGVKVFVYEGDLLDLDVDAIVHGTNTNLNNSHGLSAAIAKAAGTDLENACKNVFLERNLNVGDCCCTTAGDLHYDYIIHAVTPMWSAYRKTSTAHEIKREICQDDLCRTIMNALEEAVNVAARSVALPVIGYAQCPSDVLTAAFSEAMQLTCDEYKKSSLKQIHIVGQHPDILKKIKDELLQAKKWNDTTTPVTTSGRSSQHVSGASCVSGLNTNLSNYPRWMAKSETGGTCMLSEKLNVCIVKGTYVTTQASALVSIEDEMFRSKRFVAMEIAKEAGDQYKKEIDKLRKNEKKYKISDVVCTHAGAIPTVSYVFHVIGPVADKDISGKAELFKGFTDNIGACISKVLRRVDEKKLDSIVLPSFASGTLKPGQTNTMWEICVEEVEKFAAKKSSKSTLRTIFLVGGLNDVQFLLQIFDSKITHMATVV
ncbi:uncharacterized protein LOC117318596 [Pecten maximus]|uniref:uncharacterized protein LOC117318596 n=1 Tax=Pecten maximus TaxID=6579 RepID=UPI00145881A6|nr:uncharacterized protein LOC117318596 [Pecten maximus]